ncbi:MAG TPA: ATPase domain-containing protein [Chloroflexota bacterium]|nr:ATPase domain-containing protein [Chloroflexota bacterium]
MTEDASLPILPTRIAGLDTVLRGGLVRNSVCLVLGPPGAGKTVLGNQIAFNAATDGTQAVIATLLVESHDRMMAHLRQFAFFVPGVLGEHLHFISIYDEVSHNGLDGCLDLIRSVVREHRAGLLVLDGAGRLEDFATSELEFRRFTYELQIQLAALGCTAVLLSDQDSTRLHPIEMHVDGIIALQDERVQSWAMRSLEVRKLRGVDFLRGRHALTISRDGIQVFPRLEAISAVSPAPPAPGHEHLAFGVPGLDDMLQGGLGAGTMTMILGAPGAGKTISGLHFASQGLAQGERAMFVTFNETPEELLQKSESVGLDLRPHVREGRLRIHWQPPLEVMLDAWTQTILSSADELKPRRLVLDGVSDLERQDQASGRLPSMLAALGNELRARGVTTLLTTENRGLVGGTLDVPLPAPSATVGNIILLRYVELQSQLHRLVSVLKTRSSAHDTSIREFVITERGIQVSDTFESAEAVLTGVARFAAPTTAAGAASG